MKADILNFTGLTEKEFYDEYKDQKDWEESSMGKKFKAKKFKAKTGGSFKAHKMYDSKGKSKMAKTLKEHLALKKKGWGHDAPKAQFGSQFGSNFGGVDTNILDLDGNPINTSGGFGEIMNSGAVQNFGVPILNDAIEISGEIKAQKEALGLAKQNRQVSDIALQASKTTPEKVDRSYVRPEDFTNTGEEFFPVYGVGTNALAKHGGTYKAQDGTSTKNTSPQMKKYLLALEDMKIKRDAIGRNDKEQLASFTGRNKSFTPYSNNELARDFSELQQLRQAAGLGAMEEASILFPHVGQQMRGGFNSMFGTNFKNGGAYKAQDGGMFNGEYMPLVNPNQQKAFGQGGYLRQAQQGGQVPSTVTPTTTTYLSQFQQLGNIANQATDLIKSPNELSASGKFAGGVGESLGSLVGMGKVGKFIGENVFNDMSGNLSATRRYNKGTERNISAITNNLGAVNLHSNNVATRNGGNVPSYRSGGNMRGDYVSPNPSALDTMAMGGQLKTLWGGKAETVAYNPYSGGESVMFKGNSHETRDSKVAETGIGVSYGDDSMGSSEQLQYSMGGESQADVEVEGGEPAFESISDEGKKKLEIIGDMFVMKELLPLIGDDRIKGKKMKNFVGKDIHSDEVKANNIINTAAKISNDSSSDSLALKTAEVKEYAGNIRLMNAANTKKAVANVQEFQNVLFDHLGADANKFMKTGKLIPDPMRADNNSIESSKNGKTLKAQNGPPTDNSLDLNTLPDEEKVYKSVAEAEKDGYVLNKQTGKYERTVGNKVEKAELEIGANETYDRQSKTDDGLYGNVTMEIFEEAKAANPWFDWTDFDPSNKSDVKKYQNEFNKRAEEAGSDVRINPDGMFGNQTSSAKFTPATEGSEPSVEIANIEDADTTTTEQTTINPMFNALGNLLNQRKKTNDYTMDPNQISGELYSAISNREEPVDARFFTPSLRTPYDISLQAQKNDVISQNRAMMRNPVFANSPASQSMASAETYAQLERINQNEFIANQQMKDAVYSGNLEKIDQAKMMNMGIADQQQDRMLQGRANTRKERIDALTSIGNKYAQHDRDVRRNQVLANMYPTFGFDDNYQTQVQSPATFNIPGQGSTGVQGLLNQILQKLPNQEKSATAKYGKKVTKNNKNSNILREMRNL